ncbi:gamma-glutamyl-gamma-aminobutyrate hydrolase family protein [Streptomyces sp. N2-109]|uniref:Gamma-glutamyl-gamma-aminobutyrate hydrolase family protein n=1 Tax=Streptomyces gossypii TaxID=2883101 RepID=A0ABT2JKX3_9ACTN|nr:gamma-glutamyl-gamma-aminobutyrate hydrolase family protein [Streptomyces gossypii]MCT2588436.1 gamma-glutamyl-gamma-aminobutyrate hydrolase family protein [Streptomyces gossypii]
MNSLAHETAGAPDALPRPVIGVTAHSGPVRVGPYETHATFVPQLFIDRIAAAGCTPVLLPPLPGLEHSVPALDGLMLLAGPDLDPGTYGAQRHARTVRTLPDRDAAELALLEAALEARLPLLGICRGLQLLNVLRGGTLHQHLPEIVGHEGHYTEQGYLPQEVELEAGSYAAKVLGGRAVVPCHHHQAVDRLGEGLTVTARAKDGTVEAIEAVGQPFALTVQWHAEESEDDRPFLALAEAARHTRTAAGR